MMHTFVMGILLGWGAAVPIGPVNLEIIRRHLHDGMSYGIVMGLGACLADVSYLVLLCLGTLSLLQYPGILRFLGVAGSLILAWFGLNTLFLKPAKMSHHHSVPSHWRYTLEGYLMTLINPFTVLFWASVSSQISLMDLSSQHGAFFSGCGVVMGTVSWVLALNILLYFTRHRLSTRTITRLNYVGGIILLAFAAAGIVKALR